MALVLALLSLATWLALALGWHGFWRADQRLPHHDRAPETWPRITALVPARNEAEVIAPALTSLATQAYAGRLDIVLIDDSSTDATADIARGIDGVTVLEAPPLPPGWAGKLWALNSGLQATADDPPDFYWLSDADIAHAPEVLGRLVSHAMARDLALTSLMVRLRCVSLWEKLLVPAFIFYFQLLYPFRAVNDPSSRIAGAAGGCVLIRAEALHGIGGFAALKDAIIDDCTLARLVKRSGRSIWLGLGEASRSLRGYDGLAGLWAMVTRSAFTQLRYSWTLLMLCMAGLAVTYVAPPLVLVASGISAAGLIALAAFALMTMCYRPTVRHYRLNPLWALTLPVAAVLFGLMTVHSAVRHARGQGVKWKGRAL